MKILWVVNSILNELSKELYGKESNGVWMDAILSDIRNNREVEIVIVTVSKRKSIYSLKKNNITYYVLPDKPPTEYVESKKSNLKVWKKVIQHENPDLIHIWGTEFTHGICAIKNAGSIPILITLQGYLYSIARYYKAGIPNKTLKRSITFRDIVKQDSILQQQKKYFSRSEKEHEMLKNANAIICENDWGKTNMRAVAPQAQILECRLSINKVFFEKRWNINAIERYSIMCNASGYTIKGLHMLLYALSIIKDYFPQVKLYVPGQPQVSDGSLEWFFRKRGYTVIIEKLIKKLNLKKNVIWLGHLSQEKMAEEYAKHHVFVMPSAIENQSSSLIEAMMTGTPSIASYVGGTPDYVKHGLNGFLYRFEEYAILAQYIIDIFNDDNLANRLSMKAHEDMIDRHSIDQTANSLLKIYEKMSLK